MGLSVLRRDGRSWLGAGLASVLLTLGLAVAAPGAAIASNDCSWPGSPGCLPPSCVGDQVDDCNETPRLHNGVVQHHPRVYLIFWGPNWSGDSDLTYLTVNVFGRLRGSAFNNILTGFYDAAGHIANDTVLGGWDLTTDQPQSAVSDDDIRHEIDAEMAKRGWSSSVDTQFIVFLQHGTNVSNLEYCGRHFMHDNRNGNAGTAAYVLYPSDRSGCNNYGVRDSLVWTALHEYAEAATDPQGLDFSALPGNVHGWATDDPVTDPIEIADQCAGHGPQTGALFDVALPLLWSPAVSKCTIGHGKDYLTPDPGWPFHTVYGAILDKYLLLGETTSALGAPISEEHSVGSGRVSNFVGAACGGSKYGEIYWTSATGANEVHGCIDQRYQLGIPDQPGGAGPTSAFGFPTTDEKPLVGGAYNTFAGTSCGAGSHQGSGSAIYWNAAKGAAYEMHGCLYQNYLARGGPGSLGLPTSNEIKAGSGYYNLLAGSSCGSKSGSGLYWINSAAFQVYGCIFQAYLASGGPTGPLGFPTSDEYASNGGRRSDFQCGSIIFTTTTTVNLTCGNTSYYSPQVTTLESNTSACPGSQEFFNTTDANGVPVSWTYANGSHQCIRVLWQPTYTTESCTFSFYVPKGYATGTIQFTVIYLVDGDLPRTRTVTLNENPVSGYQTLFTLSGVASVQFGDNNGQSYPTQLGWGSQASHSLRQAC